MKYIRKFDSIEDYNDAVYGGGYIEPWVSSIEGDSTSTDVEYNIKDHPIHEPFRIETLGSGTLTWKLDGMTLNYRKNGGVWSTMTSATSLSVVSGDTFEFIGENHCYYDNVGGDWHGQGPKCTARYKVGGNIMSIVNGDAYHTNWTLYAHPTNDLAGTFRRLFQSQTNLIDSSELLLPSRNLTNYCYTEMFSGCTNMTNAPFLPATNLAPGCYSNMFRKCYGLVTPTISLPATIAQNGCYNAMFAECTAMTWAPEIMITDYDSSCFNFMFNKCYKLQHAPVLRKENNTRIYVSSMFTKMFAECTALTYIECYYSNPRTSDFSDWVSGVSSTGIFVRDPEAQWTRGNSGIPTNWSVYTDPGDIQWAK